MRLCAVALLFLIYFTLAANDIGSEFSRIRILVPDQSTLDLIWSTGIDYEGVEGKIGGWMEFVAGQYELDQLQAKGIPYTIVVQDIEKEYSENLAAQMPTTETFGTGSMGGHYTYAEVCQQLDSMKYTYPDLITQKDSIGHTLEGRTIWAMKISSDPTFDDPQKPEVLFTALHHAREPMGMMSLIYYMWWLLDNYGIDQEATYLVNNRQQWFIPVVNVDGYVYNQTTNPRGGGMWRKNRNATGVDLNRNYGPKSMWNSPYAPDGSSPDPASETYRGAAPFSELETQAIDIFMRGHSIRTCLNYHTYSDLLIYPFGFNLMESIDSAIYRDWTYDMTIDNRFQNGTNLQTLNYSVRGSSDDYMYGDSTKYVTFAMTPEVGSIADGGFWARSDRIIPLAIANLRMNKDLAYFAGYYPIISGYNVQHAGGNGFVDKNENFTLILNIKNLGIGSATDLSVSISSSNSSIQFSAPAVNISDFARQAYLHIPFVGKTDSNTTTGVPFQIYVEFSNADGFQKCDTIKLYIGAPSILYQDNASIIGMSNWIHNGGWALSAQSHSQPSAFADTSYTDEAEDSFTTRNNIDLNNFDHAQLRFWTKWEIEPTWDFATVAISTDDGTSWQTLRTSLTRKSSEISGSKQPAGIWGYDSYTPGQTWVEQIADLSPFTNNQIKIQFKVSSDGATRWKGFFVDDIVVYGFVTTTNGGIIEPTIPSAFALDQNYPNPFNLKTRISFSLATESVIQLQLFDILGRSIKMIASGKYQSGPHHLFLDASTLPSGIYFYRLNAGNFTAARKLLLLK